MSQRVALGEPRHDSKDDGQIHSVRTAQSYTQALSGYATFAQVHRLGDLKNATVETAQAYLVERQESGLSQSTLDLDRQALQCHLQQPLERVFALEKTQLGTRSYTPEQIREIANHQNDRNSLATEIAYAAGLRGHELQTLQPVIERPASAHREWSDHRFTGRSGERYTVQGKGGLIREVIIPHKLAFRLEATRFATGTRLVIDRGVHYQQRYDIGSGKNWATSFSRVSQNQLGWNNGAHGVRHTYAQERMNELQGLGFRYIEALGTVAQELGHFAASTTEKYLR